MNSHFLCFYLPSLEFVYNDSVVSYSCNFLLYMKLKRKRRSFVKTSAEVLLINEEV